jgi:phosphoribosylglycinamide formyltransferase 2
LPVVLCLFPLSPWDCRISSLRQDPEEIPEVGLDFFEQGLDLRGTHVAGDGLVIAELLLGSGELGKEVAIEAQRLGVEVIAVDRYPNAPAMQVAHRSHVIDMLDRQALRGLIEAERPGLIVPEIEAIATQELVALEAEGFRVVPTAGAARLTMDREGIRRLAAEELGLATSPFRFADDEAGYRRAIAEIGLPCVVKPVMSSSGKGQSTVRNEADIEHAWQYSQRGGRTGAGRVIVEGFVEFDYEITLLTVRHGGATSFCAPIGHLQVDGDYRESWQPQPMSARALERAQRIADAVTCRLGGSGIFGVELFVRGDEVLFSEVSPRPHDTGLVTLVSQSLSQFALHVRAILGLAVNFRCPFHIRKNYDAGFSQINADSGRFDVGYKNFNIRFVICIY